MLYRYAGKTARAILEPYGFVETHSDDWVSCRQAHLCIQTANVTM